MFVDTNSGELRHGLPEFSPVNVVVVCEGELARIRFVGGEEAGDIACLPEYSAVIGSEKYKTYNNEVASTASV